MKSLSITPSRDITTDAELVEAAASTFTIEGNRIVASDAAASIEVYNTAAVAVAAGTGSVEVGSAGIYMVRITSGANSTIAKAAIR